MAEPEDKSLIRRYLLGDLPEAEQQRLEELFIRDPEYRENVFITESELIEDYLDDALTDLQQQQFSSHFLATPQQRRKLRIALSLKKYVAGVTNLEVTPTDLERLSREHVPSKLRQPLTWRSPLILLPVAAGLVIVVTLGVMKLNEIRRLRDQRDQEQSRHNSNERELAQMNLPESGREAQLLTVALPPVSVRSPGTASKFSLPVDKAGVELRLNLTGEKYPQYRVLLQRMEEAAPYKIQNLHAENTPTGQVVSLRIPRHLLTYGDYRLQLFGITTNGEIESVNDYDFQVTDQNQSG